MKLAALVLVAGCSFVTTRASPRNGTCGSYTPAVVDTVISGALLALAIRSDRENGCDNRLDGCHNYDPTPLYIAPLLVFGASTVWGYTGEHSCRSTLATRPAVPAVPAAHSTPGQPPP
jgi:hypothetical protein